MHARDIMTHEVITIHANATLHDVARLLSDYSISGVPVMDDGQRLVGIVTQADLISKEGETVTEIMSPRVVSVAEDTLVDEVARVLASNRFKRVPVLRGDRVIGIVSRADIVRMMASRWICPVCGAIQQGRLPSECYACGSDANQFEHELDPRMEITARE